MAIKAAYTASEDPILRADVRAAGLIELPGTRGLVTQIPEHRGITAA
jgi:hypothetical protein